MTKDRSDYIAQRAGESPAQRFRKLYNDQNYRPASFDSCVFIICPRNNDQCNEHKLRAQLLYAQENYPRRCHLVVADTLHRHNLLLDGSAKTEEEAWEMSRQWGQDWLEKFLPVFMEFSERPVAGHQSPTAPARSSDIVEKFLEAAEAEMDMNPPWFSPPKIDPQYEQVKSRLSDMWFSPFNITMWDDLIAAEDVEAATISKPPELISEVSRNYNIHSSVARFLVYTLDEEISRRAEKENAIDENIERLYQDDKNFRQAINDTVELRINTLKKRRKNIDFDKAARHCREYLLEDLAGMHKLYHEIWMVQSHQGDCPVEIYPGNTFAGHHELFSGRYKLSTGRPIIGPVLDSIELIEKPRELRYSPRGTPY